MEYQAGEEKRQESIQSLMGQLMELGRCAKLWGADESVCLWAFHAGFDVSTPLPMVAFSSQPMGQQFGAYQQVYTKPRIGTQLRAGSPRAGSPKAGAGRKNPVTAGRATSPRTQLRAGSPRAGSPKAGAGRKNPVTAGRATSRGAKTSQVPGYKQVQEKVEVPARVSPAVEVRASPKDEVPARAPPAKAPGEGAFEFIKKTICGLDYVKNDKHRTKKQAVRFLMSKDGSGRTRWDWVVKDALKLKELDNAGQLSEDLKVMMTPFANAIYFVSGEATVEGWHDELVRDGLIELRGVEEVESARSIPSGLLNEFDQCDEN